MSEIGHGLDDQVVAITGASSGIGRAIALLLAERGAAVALGARGTDRLDSVMDEIRERGGRAISVETDVTKPEDLIRLVGSAVEEFGRLDVMVNNAGTTRGGPLTNLDTLGWAAIIDVNLKGVLNGIAAALPIFRSQGRGHFVTTISTAGLQMVPDMAVYAASKNAVRTLLEGLRLESSDGVVRTTGISPGYIRTNFPSAITDAAHREAIQRNMDQFAIPPEAVARAVVFAIEQPHDVEIGDITIRPTTQSP